MILACGQSTVNRRTVSNEDLRVKAELYEELQDRSSLSSKFDCDQLLFSGLMDAASPSLGIDIKLYTNDGVEWHRTETHQCYDNGGSKSSISRDMIVGLMWSWYKSGDLESAEKLLLALRGSAYILKGSGDITARVMNPAYISTLALLVKKLGGPLYAEAMLPVTFNAGEGFVRHLQTWLIALRGELKGGLTASDLDVLKTHMDSQPNNPLFASVYHKYTDGNQSAAIRLLLDASEWPSDRLPTTFEHCDKWPIERDFQDSDWGPCSPEEEHTGMDLVVITRLILGIQR